MIVGFFVQTVQIVREDNANDFPRNRTTHFFKRLCEGLVVLCFSGQ